MAIDLLKEFSQFEAFEGVPESQLSWLAERSDILYFEKGDRIIKMGGSIIGLVIILEGTVGFRTLRDGKARTSGEFTKGAITGALPFSRATKATGDVFVIEDVTAARLSVDYFREMVQSQYELTEKLVHRMTTRVRDFTHREQQNEKLYALGKLSAGLAHELNNPSAAVVRTANDLRKNQNAILDRFSEVSAAQIPSEQVITIHKILATKIADGLCPNMSLMEKTDLEDEIAFWLEDRQIEEAYELANTFVEFNIRVEQLEEICTHIPEKDNIVPLVRWMGTLLNNEKLVIEISEASKRISNLVTSIKQYTHMDKSPEKQATDIHKGIRNTITILNHKFRKYKVQLQETFQAKLPQVQAYTGALNQVWTNLIDNALDAMAEQGGNLEIATRQDGDFVKIHVIDSGVGIPPEVQSKIFDPFFTTKEIGQGTGLGLDTVKKIIDQHNGDIKVNSAPGRTEFIICLPM